MHLHLRINEEEFDSKTTFLRDRLYVVRTLVPPGYETYFREHARYISAHTSTAIEGNRLGEQQAFLVLVEGANTSVPDEVEVSNLEEAYQLTQQLADDKSVMVDNGLIRTMNSIILKDLPGTAAGRRGQFRVGASLIVDATTRNLRYRPPPPEWVPELMNGLVSDIQSWMGNEVHPGPVIAALAHFGLISIHPFEDGNGRTARLLADMIIHQTGWSAEGMVAVSQVIWGKRTEYYDSLRDTQGADYQSELDVTPFVEFHTSALGIAASQLEDRVIAFNRRRDEWVEHLEQALNPRQTLGLMFMLDLGPLSTSAYAQLTGTSQSSAYADLKGMTELGVLLRTGRGRNTRYRVIETVEQGNQDEESEGESE